MGQNANMMEYENASGARVMVPETAVQTLTREHQEKGVPYNVQHRAIHSSVAMTFDVIDARPLAAPATTAFLAIQPQSWSLFNYKEGDAIADGTGTNITATYADTSLTEARRTPYQSDVAIGAITLGQRSTRIQYSEAAIAAAIAATGAGSITATTLALLRGKVPFWDPGSLISPPQVDAPFNLERGIEQLLRPFLKIELVWNGNVYSYLGMGDRVPNAAAVSYQRAAGTPSLDNALMVPEGLIWRRTGLPVDTELEVRVSLTKALAIPIQLPAVPLLGQTGTDPVPVPVFADRVHLDMCMALHSVCFNQVSSNAG